MTGHNPLHRELAALIRAEGPLSIARYMQLCLAHPVHGYYRTRDPLGAAGDFITAPEISQMFGELIGLWVAEAWDRLGRPAALALAELGPGRGTLMADALRALAAVPTLKAGISVHLVETSAPLRAAQERALSGCAIAFHDGVETLPDGPIVVIGNEFLDALPFQQFERRGERWHERLVGLNDAGGFAYGLAAGPARDPGGLPSLDRPVPEGAIFERSLPREAVVGHIARRFAKQPGIALFIDYGHARQGFGDTFQAVMRHAFADPLERPGEADLTSHVDFARLKAVGTALGARVFGPLGQGTFLKGLGIDLRAARLKAGKAHAIAAGIEAAHHRLTAPEAMGQLFQVLAIAPGGVTALAPFD